MVCFHRDVTGHEADCCFPVLDAEGQVTGVQAVFPKDD